ncbi:TIGR03503 family protein [Vibrio hippocampi]|uniref:TIGR03503 family protein n=1 Tax=Vibrio hippocampi TaxID=654686 RepID=A0ABM8ZFW2_9VIBR|nr:TIGR03503 family protein [Vibrio hippocampi]CAH0524969.1 hypothetical protein VHP8226_00646 [Vibrio hippocampi]
MIKVLLRLALWLVVVSGASASESTMPFLDNRFRVDETVKQISFLIYREQGSGPVTLVRPDGEKYYSSHHPEHVTWMEEKAADIITIVNPMPGPWQAIGKVSPKNSIRLISELSLNAQRLPERLYQGERLKFTANLESDGQALLVPNLLDHTTLKVVLTRYFENQEGTAYSESSVPTELGVFHDDGKGLDERAGDGHFTIELPISIEPGRYRVHISTGNGVFLRATEQQVFVYPTPIVSHFIQAKDDAPHKVIVRGEPGAIEEGSLATSIVLTSPDKTQQYVQRQSKQELEEVVSEFVDLNKIGTYYWSGEVFANEAKTGRALTFDLLNRSFSIVGDLGLEQAEKMRLEALEARRKAQQEAQILAHRDSAKKKAVLMIAVGNLVVLLLVGLIWWIIRRKLAVKASVPEMQLKMPG